MCKAIIPVVTQKPLSIHTTLPVLGIGSVMNNINSAVFVSLAYFDGNAHLPELNFGRSGSNVIFKRVCRSLCYLEARADNYELVVIVGVRYAALVTHPKLAANSMVAFPIMMTPVRRFLSSLPYFASRGALG